MLEFFIPMAVTPKQSMRMGNGISYTKTKVKQNAEAMVTYAIHRRPPKPFEGAVRLDLVFQTVWRKQEPQRNRDTAKPKYTRPDFDNLCKQMCDVLQACGFVTDDAQFADVRIRKVWTDYAGVQVRIEEMT